MYVTLSIMYRIIRVQTSTTIAKGGDNMQANQTIRQLIAAKRLKHYEVAAALGVSEYTLCKWLRIELQPERKKIVIKAIDEASKMLGV